MYHYVIPFSYTYTDWHILYIMCSVWPHPHPYTNVWPEVGVVVLHVKDCLQTCCFVVFIVVSYHTHIQSFSFITCPISQLCAQICPYYNVWPGAVYCCFNKNYNIYNIFNMMLHAGLASLRAAINSDFVRVVGFLLCFTLTRTDILKYSDICRPRAHATRGLGYVPRTGRECNAHRTIGTCIC